MLGLLQKLSRSLVTFVGLAVVVPSLAHAQIDPSDGSPQLRSSTVLAPVNVAGVHLDTGTKVFSVLVLLETNSGAEAILFRRPAGFYRREERP
jgi:hypothetical protein